MDKTLISGPTGVALPQHRAAPGKQECPGVHWVSNPEWAPSPGSKEKPHNHLTLHSVVHAGHKIQQFLPHSRYSLEPWHALRQQDEGGTASSYTSHATRSIQLKFTQPVFSRRCSTTTPTHSRLLGHITTRNRFWQQSCKSLVTTLPNDPLQALLWCYMCAGSSCLLSPRALYWFMAQAKKSSILFLLQPWHCGHTADAPTSHLHEPLQPRRAAALAQHSTL